MMAMTYGTVYVAHVAMGASDTQTVKAFLEAEAYRRAVADHRLSPLHRAWLRPGARPGTTEGGGAIGLLAAVPLQSGAGRRRAESVPTGFARRPTLPLEKYIYNEGRYTMLVQARRRRRRFAD